MRKFLIPLMLASVAIPAAAIARDDDRDTRRAARTEQRQERADRPARAERTMAPRDTIRTEAPQQQQQAPREMRMARPDRGPDPRMQAERQARQLERQQQGGAFGQSPYVRPDREQRNWNQAPANAAQGQIVRDRPNRGPRVISTDGLPNDVRRGGFDRDQRAGRTTRIDRVQERELAGRTRMPGLPPGAGRGPRPGQVGGGVQSSPLPGGGELRHSSSGAQWATHWRNDRRYDWRDWRNRHRSSFHIGFYSDPYGFGYQRLGYGWQLFPSYYRSSYWLSDPWRYRLPPVYGPYRWVRYWDDAVLVDIYSGEVVDVIYDFFW